MKVYLIRHGESQDDLLNCYGGPADWDITKTGIMQAENFRKTFEQFGVDKIYSSPQKRAFKVAQILNKNLNKPIESVFELHEAAPHGYMSGCDKNLAKELFGYLLDKPEYKNASYYKRTCLPGAESPDDLDKRVKDVFSSIIDISKIFNTIAIVTHGGIITSFFNVVLHDKRHIIDIENFAYVEFDYNGKFKVDNIVGIKFENVA